MKLTQPDGSLVDCPDIGAADTVQNRLVENLKSFHDRMSRDREWARNHHKQVGQVIDIYNRNEAVIDRFLVDQDVTAVTDALGQFLSERSRR